MFFFNIICSMVFLQSAGLTRAGNGALKLDKNNFDEIVGKTELVFVNFYADWCRFSNMLSPIWDKTADLATEKLDMSRVAVVKVDCDKEDTISARFHISKYPTLKLLRYGKPAKKEYRGQRSHEAFVKFLEEELTEPVRVINTTDDIKEETKGQVIGYFSSPHSDGYQSFKKVATALKDECLIVAGFGAPFSHLMPGGSDLIIVRKPGSTEEVAAPQGMDWTDTEKLAGWAQRICVALVREITFENAEELTEEGNPFMIMFHDPSDKETPKKYGAFVENNLFEEKAGITFLTADGLQFAHPLHHLGKSKDDLPLIAIDSFRHMYIFPDIKQMEEPDKLRNFIADLHSGKLHRDFHYGPQDPAPSSNTKATDSPTPSTPPPESVFKKLGPSNNRYSLLKDEL